MDNEKSELWFITGSQHLYGPRTLEKVGEHSRIIAQYLSEAPAIPVKVVFKPVMTTPEAIYQLCLEANASANCVGLITWMHTFSPAKMWIAGLRTLSKPFVHLHTQFNRELPWSTIDMDFMNLNQSAHGDREFGFGVSRMRINRKVVVGVFGDNMRQVAVTEGDKVEAQIRLRYTVNGFGIGDLIKRVEEVTDGEIEKLVSEYEDAYDVAAPLRKGGEKHASLREAARIELGLRHFLESGGYKAFTDTFEDLHGLPQLPGIAVQRLMNDGYGFGAEGDWKTAALVRAMKVMSAGCAGGTSFMEDYTYDLSNGGKVLGAHMLEVCPSIADGKPKAEIFPLGIGGKADPVRLIFKTCTGPAVNATVLDMGDRFRMIVNTVEVVKSEPLPKLPVASALWVPQPNLKIGAAAWILAGGAHHTSFSQALTPEHLEDFAEMAKMEFVLIDKNTELRSLKNELRWNDLYYRLASGLA